MYFLGQYLICSTKQSSYNLQVLRVIQRIGPTIERKIGCSRAESADPISSRVIRLMIVSSNFGQNGPIPNKFRPKQADSSQISAEMIQFHRNSRNAHITIFKICSLSLNRTKDLLIKRHIQLPPQHINFFC